VSTSSGLGAPVAAASGNRARRANAPSCFGDAERAETGRVGEGARGLPARRVAVAALEQRVREHRARPHRHVREPRQLPRGHGAGPRIGVGVAGRGRGPRARLGQEPRGLAPGAGGARRLGLAGRLESEPEQVGLVRRGVETPQGAEERGGREARGVGALAAADRVRDGGSELEGLPPAALGVSLHEPTPALPAGREVVEQALVLGDGPDRAAGAVEVAAEQAEHPVEQP
jgi:hypothetical protein